MCVFHNPGWNSRRHREGRYVVSDDASGADYATTSYRNSGKNDAVRSEPDCVPDCDRSGRVLGVNPSGWFAKTQVMTISIHDLAICGN